MYNIHMELNMEKSKTELVEYVKELENNAKDFDNKIEKVNAEARLKEFEMRKQIDKLNADNASLNKQIELLKNDLNKLAGIIDEYVYAYQDHLKLFSSLQRNATQVEKHLQTKIEAFNTGVKK